MARAARFEWRGVLVNDPLARARALMALALSTTSQEEARTTAVIALRLIDKHKLLEQPAPQRAPSRGVSWSGPGSVAWEEFMRATAAAAPPQPKPRPWNPAEHKRAEAPPGYKWTTVPR